MNTLDNPEKVVDHIRKAADELMAAQSLVMNSFPPTTTDYMNFHRRMLRAFTAMNNMLIFVSARSHLDVFGNPNSQEPNNEHPQ